MAMHLLPYDTSDVAQPEPDDTREDSRGDHNSKEIPQAANELPTRQLLAE
jgi:hypothetical protein